jgi:hypothetical protein
MADTAALREELGSLGLDRPMERLDAGVAVQNRIVVVSGFRGSGKTTVAARILQRQPHVIVYDPNEDPAYSWVPNTVHEIEGEEGLREFFRWVRREQKLTWAVRYIPEEYEGDVGGLTSDANEFCRFIFTGHDFWVCFEEVHQIAQTPSPSSMPAQLRKLINRGRHREINVVVTGIRYSEISRPITAGANLHIVFHTAEPGDREQLVQRIGTEATDAVANLGPHEAIAFDTFTRKWIQINSRDAIRLEETS